MTLDLEPALDLEPIESAPKLDLEPIEDQGAGRMMDIGSAILNAVAIPQRTQVLDPLNIPFGKETEEERLRKGATQDYELQELEKKIRKGPSAFAPVTEGLTERNFVEQTLSLYQEAKQRAAELHRIRDPQKAAKTEPQFPSYEQWLAQTGQTPDFFATLMSKFSGGVIDTAAGAVRTLKPSGAGPLADALSETAGQEEAQASVNQGVGGKIARGVGGAASLLAGNPTGKIGALTGALRASTATYEKVLRETGSEEQAGKAGAATFPQMLAYMGVGHLAAKGAGAALGEDASALQRGLVGTAAAGGANVATSAAISGGNYGVENFAADTLFALFHGYGEFRNALAQPRAEAAKELERRGLLAYDADTGLVRTPDGLFRPDGTPVTPNEKTAAVALHGAEAIEPLSQPDLESGVTKPNAKQISETSAPDGGLRPRGELSEVPAPEGGEGIQSSGQGQRVAERPPEAPQQVEEPSLADDWTSATAPTRLKPLRPGEAGASGIIAEAAEALKRGYEAATVPRKMSDLRESTLNWTAAHQKSADEIFRAQKEIGQVVKDPIRGAAITNWIEAAGDAAELKARAAATSDKKLRAGYEAAANLSPAEQAIATKIKVAFDRLGKRAQYYDLLNTFRDNYTPHIWEREKGGGFGGTQLREKMRFAKQRTFDTFFAGEQAGFKPRTKDIRSLLPAYIKELNDVVAAKQLVERMAQGKASDGRPLVAPRGVVQTVENEAGKAHLVMPDVPAVKDTGDYKVLENNPALHDWRWRAKDDNGNPIFVKGDLALHPEAYAKLKNALGQSALREWYNSPSETPGATVAKAGVKFIDRAQSEMKATMLGMLSSFHQVQEGTHAVGHRVNPFFSIPKIDLRDPGQMDAARHGLMLRPDRLSEANFMEGLGNTGLLVRGLKKVPVLKHLGNLAETYSSFLFHQYIPGLKYKTYEHALPRNMKRFAKELASGEITEAEVKALTAEQMNAAYGHLNYTDLGRNPTMQHLLRLGLLAPDFLEARSRFLAQAGKTLLGGKSGREQFAAIALLAATQWGIARILNKTLDDDWHFDRPFEVVHKGRRYSMRSVPEDFFNLIKDTRQFVYGRLSPLIGKGLVQGASGVNYRGEKVTPLETLGEVIAQYIPLTARWVPGVRELTQTGKNRPVSPLEELAGTLGIRISRFSPITETYSSAQDWLEKSGKPKDRGTYPVSKYQQLRYALEDGDLERAKAERKKLLEAAKNPSKLSDGFRESLFHPFTGSLEDDRKFRNSLDERGRLKFDLATKRREEIWKRFQGLR